MPTRPPRHDQTPTRTIHRVVRPSAHARGYGKRWQRLARSFLAGHPICADPFGLHGSRRVPGSQVDHIVPLANGGTNSDSNLQTLCARCHRRKTVLCDGGFGRQRQPIQRRRMETRRDPVL